MKARIVAFALALVIAFASGCGGEAKSPARDTARAAVLLVAEGVRVADKACATFGENDDSILKTCVDAYGTARSSLIAAEAAVDAWDAGDRKDFTCALAASVRGLSAIANAATSAGAKLPLIVTDALTLGAAFAGGACK